MVRHAVATMVDSSLWFVLLRAASTKGGISQRLVISSIDGQVSIG
ncbi:MAG: hypothetical protein P0Y55_08925 [Candidatus Cohnella colombiensis]|uniref:Uncharacterized protein n=1 Tax=Candidatus Cohnella colombiensis TaxID=3121368 RepID=A0AA95JC40_9BACL|nr:MAG: hypothetical protein P0Y55_08925 [Cohnella sp.]